VHPVGMRGMPDARKTITSPPMLDPWLQRNRALPSPSLARAQGWVATETRRNHTLSLLRYASAESVKQQAHLSHLSGGDLGMEAPQYASILFAVPP
jgi:hypothetical protein